jgi:hypothetical protein
MRESSRFLPILIAGALCGTLGLAVVAAEPGRTLPDRYVRGGLDGEPVLAEHPVDGSTWAAWAYRNGAEYDIAVSVLAADGLWSEPWMFGVGDRVDQIDPDLTFDSSGTAYLAFAARQSGEVQVAVLVGGLPGWIGPQTVAGAERSASRPAMRIVADRVVLAFRTGDGVDLIDFPTMRSIGPIDTHGIQEGPDVIDPLGRDVDTGDSRSGESAGTSDGTAWRNRPGTSAGAEIRSLRSRAGDRSEY